MIHQTAIIEDGAKIGNDVEIAPFVFISKDSIIGDGSTIKQGACIYNKTIIGKNCEVGSYTVLGEYPQSIGHDKNIEVELRIGDDNIIKEYVLISLGTSGDKRLTKIGNKNYIMAYCHIGHDCIVGDENIFANATSFGGHCIVGDKNVFGAMSAIHQFVEIGSYCMIGGASAITQDIPPYMLAEGNRALVRGINSIGIRRNLGSSIATEIKKAYKTLFRSSNQIKGSAEILLNSTESKEIKNLCKFILNSKRGIPYERINEKENIDG